MTLTLTLPPENEPALKAAAQAQGVSVEQWLQHLVEERLQSVEPPPASSQTRRPLSTRIREIWAGLPEEASAEYPEGGGLNAWVAENSSKLDQDLGARQDDHFAGNQLK